MIHVRGPKGNFRYQSGIVAQLGMIAGGTGITPMFQVACGLFAAAAKGGGTYITDALAFASAFASATVLNTGRPKCSVPPFFGVTPPTCHKKTES